MVMGLRLRDFVFMVREFEVESTAMDIDIAALVFEDGGDHDAAFGMPAWAPLAPRGFPLDTFVCVLPQGEIQRRLFDVVDFDSSPGVKGFRSVPGEFAIAFDGIDFEIHVPVLCFVGGARIDEVTNVGNHLVHIDRWTRGNVGLKGADFVHQSRELADDFLSQFAFFDAEFFRPVDDLVIDVGVIGNEGHVIAKGHEEPSPGIEDDDGAEIADVGIVINSRAADVKGNLSLLDRLEGLELPT